MKTSAYRARAGAFLCSLAVLAACGGGSSEPAAPSPAPTIGPAGGSANEAGGAQVLVPAGAFQSPTTVRIAKDATGAPALPSGLVSAGDMYVVTPHGGSFATPVEVRVPAPSVALQPNQAIKLAKAQPGGEWQVLSDTTLAGGMLSTRVSSFSYFVPIIMTYPLPLVQAVPWGATISLSCDGQSCDRAVGSVAVTLSWITNGGQLPTSCTTTNAEIQVSSSSGDAPIERFPVGSGSLTRTVGPKVTGSYQFRFYLACGNAIIFSSFPSVRWQHTAYPAVDVLRMPAQMDVVQGLAASLEAVMAGGAARPDASGFSVPTPANRAVIDWQRSDDQGASWRMLARSYQDEADPQPLGAGFDWRYWSVRHGFVATAEDQGALIRVQACYTPPDMAAAPCATGPATRLNVLQQSALPSFSALPNPMLVRTGQTASLSAVATGAPAPALQWQTRAANSSGAWVNVADGSGGSSGSYTTVPLTLAANGTQFRVVASNPAGTVASPPVAVSVSDQDVAPTLTSQPAGLSVASGSDAALAVTARGTEALSYQWKLNGTALSGANAPLLRLPAVDAAQAGSYTVTVSNAAGSVTSDPAVLTVTVGAAAAVAPTIVNQPVSVLVNAGNTATFAVGVAGTAPYAYQWLKNGQPIAGATAAFYSLPAATLADAATYAVRVANSVDQVTSFNVILTVIATAQPSAVAITTQPAPQVQAAGGSATFAVAASGSGPLAYQWLKDGQPLPGQTAAVLNLAGLNGSDAGSYSVTVSNALGPVTSSAAVLTVLGTPAITAQPQATTRPAGSTASFTVTATGQGLRYLWLRNGVPVAGATSAQLTTPTLDIADSGAVYSVLVFNGAGVAVSNTAVLTVTPVVVTPTMSVLAGTIGSRGWADGNGSAARFNSPVAVALDSAGNAYVREPCLIRKVTPAGLVSTLAGMAGDCNIADGPPGTGRVGGGGGIAVNAAGDVYFSDGLGAIRRATPAGVLSTFAGDALLTGYADGAGTAARFNQPHGLAFDGAGNLFVADTSNGAVRRITPGGAVSTVARGLSPGASVVIDGPVGLATFGGVVNVTVDAAGTTVYVTDEGANSIRKIAGGVVSTLAGSSELNNGSAGSVDGSGGAARFNAPQQIGLDAAGHLYVADMLNHTVRKITPAGVVSTVLGVAGDARTVPGATPPRISAPAGLAVAATGQLWLTSLDSHVVLRAKVP